MSYPMPSILSKGLEYILGPNGMGVTGGTTSQTGTGGGSSANGSSAGFLPGQSARFTPDPTVNGPWTHTRADIPLFRQAGGSATPAVGGLPGNAIAAQPIVPPNTPPMTPPPAPKPQNPAFSGARRWRTAQRPDYRSMLADILAGK
jgi:hypothetical protein